MLSTLLSRVVLEGTAMKSTPIVFATFMLCLFLASCQESDSSSEEATGTVNDFDANVYQTVRIGDQWWMAENLRTTHYQNGEEIPNVTDGDEWRKLTSGAYGIYEHDPDNAPIYGLHYNWYAASYG